MGYPFTTKIFYSNRNSHQNEELEASPWYYVCRYALDQL